MSKYFQRKHRVRSRPNANKRFQEDSIYPAYGNVSLVSNDTDEVEILDVSSFSGSTWMSRVLADSRREFEIKRFDGFKPFIWQNPKDYSFERCLTGYQSHEWIGHGCTAMGDPQVDQPYIFDIRTPAVETSLPYYELMAHYLDFNQLVLNQKVDVLTSLAESKSTFSMLANAFTSLCTLYRAVRKGDIKQISRFKFKRSLSRHWRNKTAQNRWLELQYGWSPLFSDLKKAMVELSLLPEAPILKFVKSSVFESSDGIRGGVSIVKRKQVLKTSCYYALTNRDNRNAAQWNLASNPLLTAWEKVPYSFVVDWFIPIGDFIAQYSATDGLSFISGTTSYYQEYTTLQEVVSTVSHGSLLAECYTTFRQDGISTRRLVLTESPIGFPVASWGLSQKRAVNALALITQRMR